MGSIVGNKSDPLSNLHRLTLARPHCMSPFAFANFPLSSLMTTLSLYKHDHLVFDTVSENAWVKKTLELKQERRDGLQFRTANIFYEHF